MAAHRVGRARHRAGGLLLACLLAPLPGRAAEADPVNVSVTRQGDEVRIRAEFRVPVNPRSAWDVMTDFEHMTAFLPHLKESRVLGHAGNQLTVRQTGESRVGPLSVSFESLREVELKPYQTIRSRTLNGTLRGMKGETWLMPSGGGGTRVYYKASVVPDSGLASLVPNGLLRDELKAQFHLMREEMLRRDRLQLGRTPQTPAGG
jgi:carbon monoxide dehydrogenase subunit G